VANLILVWDLCNFQGVIINLPAPSAEIQEVLLLIDCTL